MTPINVNYLELEEILAIHHDQISRYGGSHGTRDLDLLISAISRPQASFGGDDLYPTTFLKAAALMHSLILNHPFVDGNKRTGTVSTARFLFRNGYKLNVGNKELVEIVLKIATKELKIDDIAKWLEENSRKYS